MPKIVEDVLLINVAKAHKIKLNKKKKCISV